MAAQSLSLNPSSIRTRFAHGFLRALKRLNEQQLSASSSVRDIWCRYRLVKIAADASMASAVGSRRAWSRAMLWKIHKRARARRLALAKPRSSAHGLRKRCEGEKPGKEFGLLQAKELRKLVPGGKTMDFHRLLDETAHYIKCLTTQLQVQIGRAVNCEGGGARPL